MTTWFPMVADMDATETNEDTDARSGRPVTDGGVPQQTEQ